MIHKRNTVDKVQSKKKRKIDWNKYNALKGLNITGGVDPADYISKMREDRKTV